MPPRRPLPDLCIISVFKQLTPNEQMKASRMSPRCLVLVRAANRRLKSLVVRTQGKYGRIEHIFLPFYDSKHCLQLIEGSVPFFSYLLNSRFSKWNCLMLWDAIGDERESPSIIADQIVYVFSAVTDLKFGTQNTSEECEILIKLLLHPNWACQLTHLMLVVEGTSEDYDISLARRVTAALNGLSALHLLSFEDDLNIFIPDLTILARLKVIAVDGTYEHRRSKPENFFLHSVRRQSSSVTQKQLQQQVHFNWREIHFTETGYPISDLLKLGEFECSHIVSLNHFHYNPFEHDPEFRLLNKLTSLVSLSIDIKVDSSMPIVIVRLFTALSQLKQLLYLELDLIDETDKDDLPPLPPRPFSVQLPSVRALHLHLDISSHAQVKGMNLAHTLPNCQVIQLAWYFCSVCKVYLQCFTEGFADYVFNGVQRSVALNCLQTTLIELHPGIPRSKIILKYGLGLPNPECSLEQLLLLQSSSPRQ